MSLQIFNALNGHYYKAQGWVAFVAFQRKCLNGEAFIGVGNRNRRSKGSIFDSACDDPDSDPDPDECLGFETSQQKWCKW